jgi:EpsI family protein
MLGVERNYLYKWVFPLSSLVLLLGILLLVFPYNSGDTSVNSPLGISLWQVWAYPDDSQDHTYCFLVPIMIGYLLFEKRKVLAQTPVRGVSSALGLIALSLFMFWIGSRAGKQYLGCFSFQFLLLGAVLWFWGRRMMSHLWFAWVILIFAWPLPFIDTAVALPMREMVSTTAGHILNLIGVPTVQSGTALISAPSATLPIGAEFQIDVADPCSGLHSLMPLLMFSSFYAYFFLRGPWKQWTVFIAAFPFTIAGNVVRIVLLVLGSLAWGTDFAIGPNHAPSAYHEGAGYFVYVIVLGLECLLGWWLGSRGMRSFEAEAKAAAASADPAEPRIPTWRSATFIGLSAFCLVILALTPPVFLPAEAGVVMALPDEVRIDNMDGGHFYGTPAKVSDAELHILPHDTQFERKDYDDFHGHHIFFSIVLSGVQQYTIHPPEVCLVAQGWTIAGQEDIPVDLSSGHRLMVRNLRIQRQALNAQHESVTVHANYMFWYVADNLTTQSHLERNLRSSWDRVVHNRDHRWAYVIAMSAITDNLEPHGMNSDQTRDLLTRFIREIVPTFQKSELQRYTQNP